LLRECYKETAPAEFRLDAALVSRLTQWMTEWRDDWCLRGSRHSQLWRPRRRFTVVEWHLSCTRRLYWRYVIVVWQCYTHTHTHIDTR